MLHYLVVRSSFWLIGAVCLYVWAEGDAGVPRLSWRGKYDLLGEGLADTKGLAVSRPAAPTQPGSPLYGCFIGKHLFKITA